jgi:hypothetical protein
MNEIRQMGISDGIVFNVASVFHIVIEQHAKSIE